MTAYFTQAGDKSDQKATKKQPKSDQKLKKVTKTKRPKSDQKATQKRPKSYQKATKSFAFFLACVKGD